MSNGRCKDHVSDAIWHHRRFDRAVLPRPLETEKGAPCGRRGMREGGRAAPTGLVVDPTESFSFSVWVVYLSRATLIAPGAEDRAPGKSNRSKPSGAGTFISAQLGLLRHGRRRKGLLRRPVGSRRIVRRAGLVRSENGQGRRPMAPAEQLPGHPATGRSRSGPHSFFGRLLFDQPGFYVRNLAVGELVC